MSGGAKVKNKILFSWSGGKDSAMALYELQKAGEYEIAALLTTVTKDYERISMHGVREILLEKQAESLGIPLEKIYITPNAPNEEYETKMKDKMMQYKNEGVLSVAFGDIFLEDLKKYREENLSKIEMKGIFPIWKRDSNELAHSFVDSGFEAVVVCVDTNVLDKKFAGRTFDAPFLSELPSTVDPCGENGEFHSFVSAGPMLKGKIAVTVGETVEREGFAFADLLAA